MSAAQRETTPLRIGIVAGELSGDLLGANLMQALQTQCPDIRFEGIGGPEMTAAGCHNLFPMHELSVMGLFEVLAHLPRLLHIRRRLREHFLAHPPDVFIGIDAPDFNLGLEARLKAAGIRTVHYVSPSVWAWRRYRVRKVARSVDHILTLFPFEAEFYREHAVPVTFVGHSLADMIPDQVHAADARKALQLPMEGPLVALLPGSRAGEVARLSDTFIATIDWLVRQRPGVHFAVPLANTVTREIFVTALGQHSGDLPVHLIDGNARQVMAAADVVLLASGTATLEALLLKRPMVVAYRLSAPTYWLAKHLVKLPYFSLPNLLARDNLVPEFLQHQVTAENLGQALIELLDGSQRRDAMLLSFAQIHQQLRRSASQTAAASVLQVAAR